VDPHPHSKGPLSHWAPALGAPQLTINFFKPKKYFIFFSRYLDLQNCAVPFNLPWGFDSSSPHKRAFILTLPSLLSLYRNRKLYLKKKPVSDFLGNFEASFTRSSRVDFERGPNPGRILSITRLVCIINPNPRFLLVWQIHDFKTVSKVDLPLNLGLQLRDKLFFSVVQGVNDGFRIL
jgi:hypothetical protein